jgi:hypothetical protein
MQLSINMNTEALFKTTFRVVMVQPNQAEDYLASFRRTLQPTFSVGLDRSNNTILVVHETPDLSKIGGGMTPAALKRICRTVVKGVDESCDLTSADIGIIQEIKKYLGKRVRVNDAVELCEIYRRMTGIELTLQRAEKLVTHY